MNFFGKIFGRKSGVITNPWLIEGNNCKNECRTETLIEAIQCYDKAIELDPHCAEAWYKKGHCYHLLRRDEEAIQCYDESFKIHPHDAEVWYNKGQSFTRLNQQSDAQFCRKKAEEIDPRYKEFIVYSITGMANIVGRKPDGTGLVQIPADPRKWSK